MSQLRQFTLDLLSKPAKYASLDALLYARPDIAAGIPAFKHQLPINQNQREVRSQRYSIPRPGYPFVPKDKYYTFLRELYPLAGTKVHHNRLYSAFIALPKPQPLHVSAHHFEDLMDRFMSVEGAHGRTAGSQSFARILTAMQKAGFPVSTKEFNTFLFLKHYDEKNVVNIKRDWMSFGRVLRDTSSMNIFLRYAVKFDDYTFFKDILDFMKKEGIKLDRMSYDCVLRYLGGNVDQDDAVDLLYGILRDGIVFDISIINTVLQSMARADDIEGIEEVVSAIVKLKAPPRPMADATSRRENSSLMMYIDSLKIQKDCSLLFAPAPTLETFKPLITHYLSRESFQPYKLISMFETMVRYNVRLTAKQLKIALRSFREHNMDVHGQLRLINVFIHDNRLRLDSKLYSELLAMCQKSARFGDETVNDIEESWQSEMTMPYWKRRDVGSDMDALALHSVGRLMAVL